MPNPGQPAVYGLQRGKRAVAIYTDARFSIDLHRREDFMNIIHAAQAGQGGPVSIACINTATVDLGVPFDRLTATLQKCFDQHFLPVWGYPVKLYNTKTAKPTDWQFVYFDNADA